MRCTAFPAAARRWGPGRTRHWPQSAIGLAPGDSLVVVSDGVLDVFDSVESFTQAVYSAAHGQASAQSASDAILALAPAETAEDDVTVVVVRRLPRTVAA